MSNELEGIPPVAPNSEPLPTARRRGRAQRQLIILSLIGIGMFSFAYANAEFFVMLCQKAGLLSSGPSDVRGTITETEKGRPIEVFFSAAVNDRLPVAFAVDRNVLKMQLGEKVMVNYRFTNLSKETVYFRPTHDVSPIQAGRDGVMILEKCFCFDEQKIDAGASYTLPVVFTFTDKLDEETGTIFMRYFLWKSSQEQYDAFYARKEAGEDPATLARKAKWAE
jgi:cytochrome c oxidase assembly protein subunit 11